MKRKDSPTPTQAKQEEYSPKAELPVWRLLRAYAFDPSLSSQLDTARVNEVVIKVRWENLEKGPVGEYIEVVDFDPASKCFYLPIDLNDPLVLATNGLAPSVGNPQFHQQMIYAVAMTTIRHFERALGRQIFWAPHLFKATKNAQPLQPSGIGTSGDQIWQNDYVQRLRLYPHALRESNAYYTYPEKALLFGYFPAVIDDPCRQFPGELVFTCLSHDIVAHETTHAILDGMYRHYLEPTHPDSIAFHEAFADIVALFQHFSYPEVLRHQIAQTRGDLQSQNLLGELAQQFGVAIGQYGALRSYLGTQKDGEWTPLPADPTLYNTVFEPHRRGALLVAAVFDAFLTIYKYRISDLLRIATGGTGILPAGQLHPDLVNRMAVEASKAALHVLAMCIRALDYCPPLDITFGDYLRALITADTDVVPDDDLGYRLAIIESFRRRGIYPPEVKTLSVESLRLTELKDDDQKKLLRWLLDQSGLEPEEKTQLQGSLWMPQYETRKQSYAQSKKTRWLVHKAIDLLNDEYTPKFEKLTGLVLRRNDERDALGLEPTSRGNNYKVEVHSARRARRGTPDGETVNQAIVTLTQRRRLDPTLEFSEDGQTFFRSGCTLIFDLTEGFPLRFVIRKPTIDAKRFERQQQYRDSELGTLAMTYLGMGSDLFANLHRGS